MLFAHGLCRLKLTSVAAGLAAVFAWCAAAQAPSEYSQTSELVFSSVESIIQDSIAAGDIPGAVLLVGHGGQVVYRKAFGMRSLEPRRERMTAETIFDIASLTKPLATAPAVMLLVQQGKLRLNDPVSRYLPEFAANGKQEITVRQLLTHFSGLRPDLDLKTSWRGHDEALRLAFAEQPIAATGARCIYSDINYIVLGELVSRVTGVPLDEFAAKNFFEPLGMVNTRFRPPSDWAPKIAPTQYDENGEMLRGVVHDPTVRRMGGVGGSSGLFSTADDLSRFAQAMIDRSGILSPLIIEKMTTPQQPATSTVLRGLGWDIDSRYSSNRGELLPARSFGHTGFTGTSMWIDPATNTYVILLTNAVHPRGGNGTMISLRSRVATAVTIALNVGSTKAERAKMGSITGYSETMAGVSALVHNGAVMAGIDVLEAEDFAPLRKPGKQVRIGLLTNQTGVDSNGHRTIDVLSKGPGITLAAIFSPEHGVAGTLDTVDVAGGTDPATGVPVYSVYGKTEAKRRPPMPVVKGLDALVIDLQDAGVRFYTYETTTGYFLESAAQAGLPIFILDRPNPIAGIFVEGPISDGSGSSFNAYHPIPLRHGMTLGELARLFNAERHINAQLTVIPMHGWLRSDWYDSTGLAWVNPSPNLRSLRAATLYPAVALIEGTNISVGRGTDTPFELVGAPWVDARQLAAYLYAREIDGVRFVPVDFTPTAGPYANQKCLGVSLIVTSRDHFDAPESGIELAAALHKLYPDAYHLEPITNLLANREVFAALLRGDDPRRIVDDWRDALEEFMKRREPYLLYH